MGAAQAVMHQNHPRNAQQAEALRRIATSLPEVAQFTKSGSLASPQNAARAVVVLRDLLSKAEALGYTELDADPGFQSALRQATTRFGLTLGLDQADKVITALANNPATASAVPELRRQLAQARRGTAAGGLNFGPDFFPLAGLTRARRPGRSACFPISASAYRLSARLGALCCHDSYEVHVDEYAKSNRGI